MPAPLLITLTILSTMVSLAALFLTIRKDTHRIRLEMSYDKYGNVVLGVGNDSSFVVGILSVGYFDSSGYMTWIPRVGDYTSGNWVSYPIRVEPRSLFSVFLVPSREIPYSSVPHGYGVQLESGRVYFLRGTAPQDVSIKLHFASLISRITAGRYAASELRRPRTPNRDHH